MKNKKILFLLLLICILSPNIFAAEMCKMQTGGALDNILNSFYAPTAKWRSSLFRVAENIYWMWVVLEMGYQVAVKKVLAGDHQKLWYFVLVRMFTATAFHQIFVNPQFYDWVIEFFLKHGSAAGGIAINPQSGNPFGDFSPSGVMSIGDCMWRSAQNAISEAHFGFTDVLPIMTIAFPAILVAAGIYAMLGIIALTLFITALEAYVVLNAGVILLGFAGSSWTMGFWNKYLSYVGGIAIRLFVMCLILGLMNTEVTKALNVMNSMMNVSDVATFTAFYGALVGLLIKMVIFAFLTLKIPAMAGSMLTGTVNSGLGDVVAGASMMLAGAGIAAGLAKMGLNMAGGSGGGAKESLKNSLRGDGGGGMPKTSSGGSSSGGQMTPSQQAKQAGSESKRNEAIGEKVRGGANNDSNNANAQSNNSSDKSGSSDNGFANHMNDKLNSGSAPPNSNGSGSGTGSSSSNSGSTPASGGSGGSTPAGSGSSESPSRTSGNSNDGGSGAGISSSAGGSSINTDTPTGNSVSGSSSSGGSATPSSSTTNSTTGGSNSENVGSTSDAGGSPSSPSSGSIGGSSNASGTSKSINATDTQKSKAIKDSLNRNKDKLGKNFNKLNQDHHAGSAEVNVGGLHKE